MKRSTTIIGLGLGLAANAACSPPSQEAIAPPPASVEALNRRLSDVRQFIGPVAVNWESCPPEGSSLSPNTHVNAFVFNNGANGTRKDGLPKLYHTVEIGNVYAYKDTNGNVAAWCGTSAEELPGHKEVQGPTKSRITVIPVINCSQPQPDQDLTCDGTPIVYDENPVNTPGTFYQEPTTTTP